MERRTREQAVALAEACTQSLPSELRGCPMCGRVQLGGPWELLQSAHAVVLLEAFPVRPGQLVIVSREHIEHVSELSAIQWGEVQQLAWRCARALRTVLSPARVWIASLGASEPVGLSFPHVHVHVLPIPDATPDSRPARVLTWNEGVWQYEDHERDALVAKFRAALQQS